MENRSQLFDSYILYLKENGKPPESVYRFCKDNNLTEKEFFNEFASFEALENEFWFNLLNEVIVAVQSGSEFSSFTARQRFLTFGFAFLEKSLENRSLFLIRLAPLPVTCHPPFLRGFETRFKEFAKTILEHGFQTKEIADRGRLSELYPQGLYLVLRSLIDFNLKDHSQGFERSDAYWEKSVNLAFDLIRAQALDSAVDLVRFLIPSIAGTK